MKKLTIFMSIFTMALCSEMAISESNPPHQNEVKRNNQVIFIGDLLWGKVQNLSFDTWLIEGDYGSGIACPNNSSKLGFKAGIGITLSRNFNLSLNYLYLRSGGDDNRLFTLLANQGNRFFLTSFYFIELSSGINSNIDVLGTNTLKNRLYLIDLLLETSYWMSSNLRIQPFGGIRYFHQSCVNNIQVKSQLDFQINFGQLTGNNFQLLDRITRSKIGVVVGIDVKYLFTKNWFVFASILSEVLFSISDKDRVQFIGGGASEDIRFDRPGLDAIHNWEQKFGFAWEKVFGDDWLLSFRLFLQLHESLYESYGFGFTVLF